MIEGLNLGAGKKLLKASMNKSMVEEPHSGIVSENPIAQLDIQVSKGLERSKTGKLGSKPKAGPNPVEFKEEIKETCMAVQDRTTFRAFYTVKPDREYSNDPK